MERGVPAFRTLIPEMAATCPLNAPADRSSSRLLLPQKVDGPALWEFLIFSPPPVSYFPTNRAGASNPGDGSAISRVRRRPWPPCDPMPPCEKTPR